MQPTRWDLVLDLKPKPIMEHILVEVSKLFAKDLAVWPPEIEDADPATAATVKALVEERPFGLDARVYVAAFQLARMDLSREVAAYDDFVRHQRWTEAGLPPAARKMVLFVARFVVEQLLGLNEYTEGRVSRAHLLELLTLIEREFFKKDAS